MPKKQKPTGIPVNVDISLTGRDSDGSIEAVVYVDHTSSEFSPRPTAAAVAKQARARVIEQIKVRAVELALDSVPDGAGPIHAAIKDDDLADELASAAWGLIDHRLRVKVTNTREVIAQIKAARTKDEAPVDDADDSDDSDDSDDGDSD